MVSQSDLLPMTTATRILFDSLICGDCTAIYFRRHYSPTPSAIPIEVKMRLVLRIITGVSFVLFVACAILCGRAMISGDFFAHQRVQRDGLALSKDTCSVGFARSGVNIGRVRYTYTAPDPQIADAAMKQLGPENGWSHDRMVELRADPARPKF